MFVIRELVLKGINNLGLLVKKSSENDQFTGHFQDFFFFNISRTKSKTSKVYQHAVLNL